MLQFCKINFNGVAMNWFYRITVRLLLSVMVMAVLFFAQRSYVSIQEYNEVQDTYDILNSRVESLQLENQEMKEENVRLSKDMSYYEQLGREEFGLIKKNERVFIVPLK